MKALPQSDHIQAEYTETSRRGCNKEVPADGTMLALLLTELLVATQPGVNT